jgi:hypothetical protein
VFPAGADLTARYVRDDLRDVIDEGDAIMERGTTARDDTPGDPIATFPLTEEQPA